MAHRFARVEIVTRAGLPGAVAAVMPAIHHLLERWGFVKLQRYGLVKTPDGRILSMRPAVLDDGSGGRVVGWQDDDLAMAELQPWRPDAPRSSQPPQRAAPPAAPPRQLTASPVVSTAVPPVVPEASLPAQPPSAPASGAVMAAEVAPGGPVDEDDWEWTIALARARAAAEEVEVARRAGPRTRPVAAAKEPSASAEWPATEPIGAIDYDDYARVATRPAMPIPRAPAPASVPRAAPVTVIPVPSLPSIQSTSGASRLEPVVHAPVPPASLHRFPRGTGTVGSKTDAYPQVGMSDDTDPNVSVGDRTTPGIAMPRPLPSIKRGSPSR